MTVAEWNALSLGPLAGKRERKEVQNRLSTWKASVEFTRTLNLFETGVDGPMNTVRFQAADYYLKFIHVIFPYKLHYRNTSVLGPFNMILNSISSCQSSQVKFICIVLFTIHTALQKIMMLIFIISSSLTVIFSRLELGNNSVYILQ